MPIAKTSDVRQDSACDSSYSHVHLPFLCASSHGQIISFYGEGFCLHRSVGVMHVPRQLNEPLSYFASAIDAAVLVLVC